MKTQFTAISLFLVALSFSSVEAKSGKSGKHGSGCRVPLSILEAAQDPKGLGNQDEVEVIEESTVPASYGRQYSEDPTTPPDYATGNGVNENW